MLRISQVLVECRSSTRSGFGAWLHGFAGEDLVGGSRMVDRLVHLAFRQREQTRINSMGDDVSRTFGIRVDVLASDKIDLRH